MSESVSSDIVIHVCICRSLDLCFSLCLWMYMCLAKLFYSLYMYIYICMSLDSSMFLSLVVSECLYQCPAMLLLIVCVDICLLSHVSLTECVSVWLFYNSLYVCMFVSWSMFQIQIPRQKNFIIHNKSIKWNLSLRSLEFHSKMDKQTAQHNKGKSTLVYRRGKKNQNCTIILKLFHICNKTFSVLKSSVNVIK